VPTDVVVMIYREPRKSFDTSATLKFNDVVVRGLSISSVYSPTTNNGLVIAAVQMGGGRSWIIHTLKQVSILFIIG